MFVALLNYAIHFEIKISITDWFFMCFIRAVMLFIWSVLCELPKLRCTECRKLSSSDARSPNCSYKYE